jgi:hypothetical protein
MNLKIAELSAFYMSSLLSKDETNMGRVNMARTELELFELIWQHGIVK